MHDLQHDVAQALADLVAERGQRPLGRMLGHAGTTIASWGADPHRWPLADALLLARNDQSLRHAIGVETGLLQQQGTQGLAERDAEQVIHDAAKVIQGLANDLSGDRRITKSEAKRRLPELHQLRSIVNQLIGDYADVASR